MIFDHPLQRRRPRPGDAQDDALDLDTLKATLPDVDAEMDAIDAALAEAERVKSLQEEERSSGRCGCWG